MYNAGRGTSFSSSLPKQPKKKNKQSKKSSTFGLVRNQQTTQNKETILSLSSVFNESGKIDRKSG